MSSDDKTPPDTGEENTDSEASEAPKPPKVDEEPEETTAEKVEFYKNSIFICTAIGSFVAFVFTVPFDIDPALRTLQHKFVGPVDCQTVSAETVYGADNCTAKQGWGSCFEGCTKEFYKCDRVFTQYSPMGCNKTDGENDSCLITAKLFINVKGCGYPPKVKCWKFWQDHHQMEHNYPCWYSTLDPELAITDFEEGWAMRQAILSFSLPVGLFAISMIYISLKWCVCCYRHVDLSHLEIEEDGENEGEDNGDDTDHDAEDLEEPELISATVK